MLIFLITAVVLAIYVYFGYPLCAALLGRLIHKPVAKSSIFPCVTILIAAYNEERFIETTILNKLSLTYPQDKLEILIISDGSSDQTDELVTRQNARGVRLLRQEPRAGKTAALNLGIKAAKGEIIAFSDANSIWDQNTLARLVQNFADPAVGYVTGKMIYINEQGNPVGDGCTAYMKYENFMRAMETNIGSVVGVDGGIDAVRKALYIPMKADQLPDFVLPLNVVKQGYRVVYEPQALLKEHTLQKTSDEYRMRVRVALRAYWALWDMRTLLLNSKNPLFSWQLWSHKVLRYLCFVFMLGAYFANLALLFRGPLYLVLFLGQSMLYLCALLTPILAKIKLNHSLISLCHYLVVLNLASGHAFIKFLCGHKKAVWTPRKG